MQGPSNRSVVIISGLLTLLVLGGATLAVSFRNGWVHVASVAPNPDTVTALAQPTNEDRSQNDPPPRPVDPSAASGADVDQSEVAVYRGKLEEAYRALDDAYAQVRSLQTAQSQLASRGDGDRAFTEHDDGRHERRSRNRESDDD
ncbi:MAG: hypothetical protein ABMA15_10920 [Vicinamibacterales bacterium]